MKYLFNEARGAQARECLKELNEVLKKWDYRLVISIHPFLTKGYTPTILEIAEGYSEAGRYSEK